MLAFILEGLGTTELLVIVVVALILFGPRKLPQLSRSLGKSLGEFKRASEDFKRQWEKEVALEEREKEARKERAGLPPEDNSILGDATERYGAVRAEAALAEAEFPASDAEALATSSAGVPSPQLSEQVNGEEAIGSASQRKRDWL
ncbi:MAG TPA: twin-arginine translocase TatA/TatE family subunit [Pyrinomonadaceae bacterium]|jgi:sec-independent protein translocase protein TatB